MFLFHSVWKSPNLSKNSKNELSWTFRLISVLASCVMSHLNTRKKSIENETLMVILNHCDYCSLLKLKINSPLYYPRKNHGLVDDVELDAAR